MFMSNYIDHRELQARFEAQFTSTVLEQIPKIKTWKDVPYFWFKNMRKRGWITPRNPEAIEIYNEAKRLAEIEIKARSSRRSNEPNCILSSTELAQVYAGKIYTFRHVVAKEGWRPPEQTEF